MSFVKWTTFKKEFPPSDGLIWFRTKSGFHSSYGFPNDLTGMVRMSDFYDWIQIPLPPKLNIEE